jgi:hypothetical protein
MIWDLAKFYRDQLTWIGFACAFGWLFFLTASLFAKGVLP